MPIFLLWLRPVVSFSILLFLLLFTGLSQTLTAQSSDVLAPAIKLEKKGDYKEALNALYNAAESISDTSRSLPYRTTKLRIYQRLVLQEDLSPHTRASFRRQVDQLFTELNEDSAVTAGQKRMLRSELNAFEQNILKDGIEEYNNQKFKTALTYFELSRVKNPADSTALLLGAYSSYNLDDYSRSLHYLSLIDKYDQINPAAVLLAMSVLRDSEGDPQSFKQWERTGEQWTGNELFYHKYDSIRTDYWLRRGTAYLSQNKPAEALENFTELLPTNNFDVHYAIAFLKFKSADKQAIDYALDLMNRYNAEQHQAKLWMLITEKSSHPNTLTNLANDLSSRFSGNKQIQFATGVLYDRLNKEQRARNYFQKAIDIDAEYLPAIKQMGVNLYTNGIEAESDSTFQAMLIDAHRYLTYAQQLAPSDTLVNTILDTINRASTTE